MIKLTTMDVLFKKYDKLRKDIKEIEEALKAFRSTRSNSDWEAGIAEDKRKPVQVLYKTLCDARADLLLLVNQNVGIMTEEDATCLRIGRRDDPEVGYYVEQT